MVVFGDVLVDFGVVCFVLVLAHINKLREGTARTSPLRCSGCNRENV